MFKMVGGWPEVGGDVGSKSALPLFFVWCIFAVHVYRPLFKLAQMNPAHTAAVFIGLLQGAHKRWRKRGHRLYPPFPDVRSILLLYPSFLTPHISHISHIPHSSHPSLLTSLTPHTLTPHSSLSRSYSLSWLDCCFPLLTTSTRWSPLQCSSWDNCYWR